jgi:hypothetical protein
MKLGKYRHYKGGEYEVIGLATESDTQDDVVVYKSLETGRLFTRRKEVFIGTVDVDGEEKMRFECLEVE